MRRLALIQDSAYQIRQLKMFQQMVEKGQQAQGPRLISGYITHHKRPVYYSPTSRTALAESELVYKDGHVSRSVYVAFPVEVKSAGLAQVYEGDAKLAIWTTTPWTLPANAGVNIHVDMQYLVVTGGLIVAESRKEALEQVIGQTLVTLATLKGEPFLICAYNRLGSGWYHLSNDVSPG